jgi:hypothetical protein
MKNEKYMHQRKYKLYYCESFPYEKCGEAGWRHSGLVPVEHVGRLVEQLEHEPLRNPIVVTVHDSSTLRVHPGKSRCLAFYKLGYRVLPAVVKCLPGAAFPFPDLEYFEITPAESAKYFQDDLVVEYDHRHWAAKSNNRSS